MFPNQKSLDSLIQFFSFNYSVQLNFLTSSVFYIWFDIDFLKLKKIEPIKLYMVQIHALPFGLK